MESIVLAQLRLQERLHLAPEGIPRFQHQARSLGASYLPQHGRGASRAGSVDGPSREGHMRRLHVAVGILSVLALTGCPSEFGKGGRIDKASNQDAQSQLGIKRCSEAYKDEVCNGPQRNERKCRECGG